jgi:hypothetical protein
LVYAYPTPEAEFQRWAELATGRRERYDDPSRVMTSYGPGKQRDMQ